MDNNPQDGGQHVSNKDNFVTDCLRNPVVLRNLLEHFTSPELLQLSFVNKLWKYEARSVLRKRGNLIANLRSNQVPRNRCDSVIAFVSDLSNLGAAPISGISFEISYRNHSCSSQLEDLVRIQDVNLLDQLSLKSVSVKMDGQWLQFLKCSAFLLSKKVLQQFCGDLEELELSISFGEGSYIEKVLHNCYFPRLKILKVTASTSNEDIENYMRALMSRAPNLKMVHTNWDISAALQFLRGTSVEFVYTTPISAPFYEIPENFISAIRLEWIDLEYTGHADDFERFNRIAPILLQESRTSTIRYFKIDAVLALPLMCYGTRLGNVKTLWLDIGHMESIEPRILNIVKNLDFTRIFPNLDKVNVVSENDYVLGPPPEHMNAFIEQADAVLPEPLLDRSARIKKLLLPYWHPPNVGVQFFVEMFPNIQKLEITKGSRRPIPFGSIWNWLDLNELEVEGNLLPTTENLDSVFCGIFPEEVEELRLKDDEYLKKVNIVPVMPAVTCLKNLRTLTLHQTLFRDGPFDGFDEMFIFSKVTALVAFARQPALAVSLKVSVISAPPPPAIMNHLKPYMTVTCARLCG